MVSTRMATVDFDAGAQRQRVSLPEDAVVLEYLEEPAAGEAVALVERALDAPLGLPPLGELARGLARGRRRVVIAFDDPNRPRATVRTVLPLVLPSSAARASRPISARR
jgi:nickel-dependent lactate racemase